MSNKKYIIIGDGIAGASAAEHIRREDKEVEIQIFTDDSEPLYNRIMLKTYMKGNLPKQYTRVHDKNWYDKRDISLNLEKRINDVERSQKTVETETGQTFSYDKLLIATGGNPRKLPEDEDFDNIHYMWNMHDADKIREAAEEASNAVVIGGGLLGIDLAVAFASHDVSTDYLIRGSNWWNRGLDGKGAEIIHRKMEELGINVQTETEVENLYSEDNKVEKVMDSDGKEYECDKVAVAIGQKPNSDITEVKKNDHEMIQTDKFLKTSDQDIFAAGNMVEYQSPIFERKTVNGSWDHSEEMGKTAGRNMLGEKIKFDYVNTYGVGHFKSQFLAIGDWSGEPISRKYENDEDHYRRLFFDGDRIVGAVLIGYTKGQEELKKMIKQKKTFENKERLLDKEYWQNN